MSDSGGSRLSTCTLLVRDYDEAIAFFVGAMGLKLLEDTPRGRGKRWVVVCPAAGAGLLLAKAEGEEQLARVGDQCGGRVGFFLETDDFARDHKAFQAKGVKFLEEPRHESYGSVAVFQDISGNKWDLIQRYPTDDGVDVKVSSKFLTRNDYCQTFIDTGLRPQNFIRDLDYQNRYSEYPKIERLIKLKDDIISKRATPGMSLKCDLKSFDLTSLGTKFDVILLDPPWEEYQTRVAGMYVPDEDLSTWSLEELKALKAAT
ncbi:unnamed protein product [Effrenium voratum]|uniref:VOC domain-containing protein n=1 Tax=Effrenium voratum TaxID=2562239 RepID=A0AA36N361_9DINO|nr:unnamed protein product [Effrenium voratum]